MEVQRAEQAQHPRLLHPLLSPGLRARSPASDVKLP
jgi:hypothetical protein